MAEPVVSSRKVRKERQKTVKQTVLLLLAAVIILLTFIFVIIPGFITGFNALLDDTNPFEDSDTIAPQVPILSAPIEATFSAQIVATGFGEPKSSIIFVLNGQKDAQITADDEGYFELNLKLADGENTITAYSVDEAGNESEVTKLFTTIYDATPPQLELSNFEDGQTIETRKNQDYVIEGKTDTDAKVYVNGRLTLPAADGSFKHTLFLKEGENKVTFAAEDKAGNKTQVEKTVTFSL